MSFYVNQFFIETRYNRKLGRVETVIRSRAKGTNVSSKDLADITVVRAITVTQGLNMYQRVVVG